MDPAEPPQPDVAFEALISYIKEARGFDFTGYKRTSLARRVRHRMGQIGIDSYTDYVDRLQVSPDEFGALFNTILINVTSFFRDPDAWEHLRAETVSGLLAERGADESIRVWSAGCASGQEAYSLAMLLAEAVGADRFRQQVKIYATDVDEGALAQARHATYTKAEVEGVPSELLDRYFEQAGGRYVFHKDLRRSVIFGRNDLVQDAPISRIDLLVCRNTLMYFNAETQSSILGRFHFALAPRGLLFLGKAEMVLSNSRIFDPVDLKSRLFRKTALVAPGFGHVVPSAFAAERQREVNGLDELREHAFSASPVAQVVVTGDDTIALVNQQAELVFGVSIRDIGRPLRDLELSYRPVELRNYIEQCKVERRGLRIEDVEWQRGPDTPTWLEIHVNPLVSADNGLLGVSLVFHDVSAARRLYDDLEHANRQLASAYEELQSTNEELETTNEELQSTNDELQTINDRLRDRSAELDDVNDFLESILTSIRAGVVVVDHEMRILVWNRGAEDLWGLRRDEVVGEHLLNLDIGLPLEDLRRPVRSALTDPAHHEFLVLPAVNRRGRQATIRVLCSALRGPDGSSRGAILSMEQDPDPATDRVPGD